MLIVPYILILSIVTSALVIPIVNLKLSKGNFKFNNGNADNIYVIGIKH